MKNILDHEQENYQKQLNRSSLRLLIISIGLFLILFSCYLFRYIIISHGGELYNVILGIFLFFTISAVSTIGFFLSIQSLIKKEKNHLLSWVCLAGHSIFVGMFVLMILSIFNDIGKIF